MDDLEFSKRAYANPFDDAADFIDASSVSPQRQRLIGELRNLNQQLGNVLDSVSIPAGLADKLKAHVMTAGETTVIPIPAASTTKPSPAKPSLNLRRYYALAASLVIAVALTFSLIPQNGPSAQDLEFHNQLISHLYQEEPRYDQLSDVSWERVEDVLAAAGGHLKEDEKIKRLHVKFVNHCRLAPEVRGAHLVLEGTQGPVSVILVKGSSVSSEFPVKDKRFVGQIVPFGDGNLVIVGEKDEALEPYRALISESFEWDI